MHLLYLSVLFALSIASSAVAQSPDPASVHENLNGHRQAVHVLDVWMRDPYLMTGPDGNYYLTGTTANPDDARWPAQRYNSGLDNPATTGSTLPSIVGSTLRIWRSPDLVTWTELPTVFELTDGFWAQHSPQAFAEIPKADWRLWAPEIFFIHGKWMVVHTSPSPVRGGANLAVTAGAGLKAPFSHPMHEAMRGRHDPSLFLDDDGTLYLLWGNTHIAPIKPDLSGFAADPVRIDPSDRIIGHEGATLRKIHGKYVHFGTAWSTDQMRKGSYNLYYCVADHPMGPYGPRQFAGRFLGHGTPFLDKQGRWWCSAFYNANIPPLPSDGIEFRDLSETAQTINEQGVTLVPLEVGLNNGGELRIRAKDPRYANPGPDEAQAFHP